jgi:hypothetical protein
LRGEVAQGEILKKYAAASCQFLNSANSDPDFILIIKTLAYICANNL